MIDWKKKFESNVLERGKNLFINKRVTDLTKSGTTYRAAVLGRNRTEVSARFPDEKHIRLSCVCPAARGGKCCEHMAALLYAVESENMTEEEKQKEAAAAALARQELQEEEFRKGEVRHKEEKRREEIRKQEEERLREEARLLQEEQERQEKEDRERRRDEREKRKAERERQKKEQQEKAEESRRLEAEKRKAEEERRKESGKMQKERRDQYTLLGGSWSEDGDSQSESESIEKLEGYSYFDGARIRESMDISREVYEEGERLFHAGKVELERVFSGYERSTGEIRGQLDAKGKQDGKEFFIRMLFSRTRVTHFECGCSQCRREYYMWNPERTKCPYKASVLNQLEEYLRKHNLGDATDQSAQYLISLYHKKRSNLITADGTTKEESLKFMPRLIKKDDDLTVSFKVGEGKLFVVKKLDEFCNNVKESATATYGASTQINHSLSNFTEESKKWIRFASRIVREEEEFRNRMINSRNYYSYRVPGVGSDLNLFGWRLDEFYEHLSGNSIEYEDRDGWEKKKLTLSCGEGNPRVTMSISAASFEEDDPSGKKKKQAASDEFHGIEVKGRMPDMFFGTDTAYYINDQKLYRVDKEFLDKIEPLTSLTDGPAFTFYVGRNHMSEFYHRVLPQLKDVVEVTEEEPERIRSYLLPDVRFTFYLDAEDHNVTCRLYALYGEREVSVLDLLEKTQRGGLEPFRDLAREEEILYYTMQLLPEVDWKKRELHCGSDESLIYQIMESGTEKLMELGEVQCTKRFLGFHAVRPVKVSVGVSVSSGLLELDIATEDIPPAELLELLAGYQAKKKYYRLKDGTFVNLEDSSLEMLSELMDAAHLKPKDFVRGKMHLPMYRTLYLDKMLEENESVYSSRDSHFREVVKGFKTVKDADFEEPASLSRIMRKYQKNGYKWLRTLEHWQFGGILADDMGLGKTLQVISVLLAAKEEGKKGTSLVVCPASLIYNWGEEFERFAPTLAVTLVAGTQETRQGLIEEYGRADVLVTSYDLLKRDIAFYEEKEFQYEIIDEAQYIKNHTTAAAKAVKVIKSRIRYALTGTPIENRLSELWSIFDYLMPGFLYGYDVFKKEMEAPIVKGSDEKAMSRLQKMVSPFILRRLKEDVLKDLPEKLEEYRYVRFADTQQKLYDAQVLHMKESLARQNDEEFNKNKMLILAELTRLRQICCDPALCFENYKGEAAKLEACLQLIQSAMDGGHRILVFSQFTSMLEILQRKLKEEGIAYYTITGATSKEKRLQMVKAFNEGETPVFLISLKAGGVGLNLTGADVVIHYDPWWNLAVQNQATDRAHRIGQTKKVTVYKLIVKKTIEEKIQRLQETKKNLADQIMGGETGQLGSLTREEIMALLEV